MTSLMTEGESDEFLTFSFYSNQLKMPVFSPHRLQMSLCVKRHQIKGALGSFTVDFCLSCEKLKEKRFDSYTPVCTHILPLQDKNPVHAKLVWSKGNVVPPSSSRFVFSFILLQHLFNLPRLVRIILCPLHDCYKLCIQRRRRC